MLIGTLGVWLLLVVVLQLRSHASPDERLYGLTAAVASSAVTVLAAGYLAAAAESSDAVVVGAAGVAVAALAARCHCRPPGPSWSRWRRRPGRGRGHPVPGHRHRRRRAAGPGGRGVRADRAACGELRLPVALRAPHRGVALPLAAAAPAVYVIGRALG
ncbi:hypothetical protein NKH77_24470 [Streptomyces sp. M19]